MIKYTIKKRRTTYGINKHLQRKAIIELDITSNEDIYGKKKWYMTEGEGMHTIWYTSPKAAIEAFIKQGKKAISER